VLGCDTLIAVLLLSLMLWLSADSAPKAASAPALDEILVVGEQPGPAMWTIVSGEHALYI